MNRRTQTWIAVAVAGIALIPVAIMGLFAFMSYTATPVHPDEAAVPSVAADTQISSRHTDAVEEARRIARTHVAEQNLPGLSIAVGDGSGLVWAEGFGYADVESQVLVTPGTRFRIGTASVALTSAAAGLLVEQNRLRLDEPIRTYVPAFPEKAWPVTLRQLMAHTAGLRNDGGDEGALLGQRCERPVDALQHFGDAELLFEPGTSYRYSNYSWILVSAAIESAAGGPFHTFIRRQIFEPLDLHDTKPDPAEPDSHRATSYFPRFAADPRYGLDPMREVSYACYAGASAFVSTPSDLVRFAMAIDGGRLLRPETVRRLQTSERLPSGDATGYGLGWDLETVTIDGRETTTIGHDGDLLGGTAATLITVPAHGITVAITSNTSYAGTFDLAVKIAEVFATRRRSTSRLSSR